MSYVTFRVSEPGEPVRECISDTHPSLSSGKHGRSVLNPILSLVVPMVVFLISFLGWGGWKTGKGIGVR